MRLSIDINETIILVHQLLETYLELGLVDDRNGGYFTILDKFKGDVDLIIKVGQLRTEEINKNFLWSKENGERLFSNIGKHHLTSHDSRMEGYNKNGGAILTKDLIFSFSGLSELGDEALMLVLAKNLDQIDLTWLDKEKFKEFGDDVDKQINEGYLAGRKNEHYEKLNEAIYKEE